MKIYLFLIAIVAGYGPGFINAADNVEKLTEGLVNPGYHEPPPWFKNSFLDLREDVAEASKGDKRVMIFFYQDGCPYCAKLVDVNFSQHEIVEKTRKHFDVIAVNMWGDREVIDVKGSAVSEKKFAENMRVMFTPTLLFLTENGEVALRLNGYFPPHKFMSALDYVIGKNETKLAFKTYLEQQNPREPRGKLNTATYITKPPYNFSKPGKGKKFRLVLFEQAECPACDEMHNDVFKRPESLDLLRRFEVSQISIWSKDKLVTTSGDSISGTEWAKRLDIKYTPTMVFFDQDGNEVIRMEAYLKSFHVQSVLDYVSTSAYKEQPSFQRYIEARGDALREKGVKIDLMN